MSVWASGGVLYLRFIGIYIKCCWESLGKYISFSLTRSHWPFVNDLGSKPFSSKPTIWLKNHSFFFCESDHLVFKRQVVKISSFGFAKWSLWNLDLSLIRSRLRLIILGEFKIYLFGFDFMVGFIECSCGVFWLYLKIFCCLLIYLWEIHPSGFPFLFIHDLPEFIDSYRCWDSNIF